MWINLRTEYSFRRTYGTIPSVLDRAQALSSERHPWAGIADFYGTWGHYQWEKACRERKIKPLFGVVIPVVADPGEKLTPTMECTFVAKTRGGLQELYSIVSTAFSHSQHHYKRGAIPRLPLNQLPDVSSDVVVLANGWPPWPTEHLDGLLVHPGWAGPLPGQFCGWRLYAGCDQWYPNPEDRKVWQLVVGMDNANSLPSSQHIISEDEYFKHEWREDALDNSAALADSCTATLVPAPMVRYREPFDLRALCVQGAERKGIDLSNPEYGDRLERELALIAEKDYADYFMVVADVVKYAKRHMLVGPSRGSSAGSLVCYLLDITEVDPLNYGLLFERFIDINRKDLPDIDIDFPDSKRHIVMAYLQQKYGFRNVAHIGTISRLKAKSAIGEFAKGLGIPVWETEAVKDAIIERSTGDARAAQCIQDTFETTQVGKEFLSKYPAMELVEKAENHSRHRGVHAAGLVVCNEPVDNYVGIDSSDNVAMVDKHDAESLGLLKIDALGLRTLSILEEVCDQLEQPYDWVYTLPLDDQETFQLFRDGRLTGIFQFEGATLDALTRQMPVQTFNDIVALTSLARPGPLHCGGTGTFISRRTGQERVEYLSDHPIIKDLTAENYGTIIYQEDVMMIGREFGGLSWEDVSALRKAMSKSLGNEFFGKYEVKFMEGTRERGVDDETSKVVWDNMCTFGSWAFNKSHAVSYGLISYWCAYLKSHHPLEFAVANLNNAVDDDAAIKLLRDMVENEGVEYTAIDPERSTDRWTRHGNRLLGPITALKGIGPAKAKTILKKREEGKPLTTNEQKLLSGPSPFRSVFPAWDKWSALYREPERYLTKHYKIRPSLPLTRIAQIQKNGKYLFVGRLIHRNLRDLNEYGNVVKRGGKLVKSNNLFLNFKVEDDTGIVLCTIDRWKYKRMGAPIAETGRVGKDWYLILGTIKNNWRKINVEKIMRL